MEPIKAITFDVGGTLIEPSPSVGHIYAEEASDQGVSGLSPELLNQRFNASWKALGSRAETRAEWADVVRATFDGLSPIPDPDGLFDRLYRRFTEPSAWHLFPDVLPTLHSLTSQGKRLGIISNWDDRLPSLLDRLGLSSYFEVSVVSCNVGWRKPQREIFETATNRFRLPPHQVLHVGDNQEQDVDGARRAGLQAVGIQRTPINQAPGWISDLTTLKQFTL